MKIQMSKENFRTLRTVIYNDLECNGADEIQYSKPFKPNNTYKFRVYGKAGTTFEIEVCIGLFLVVLHGVLKRSPCGI